MDEVTESDQDLIRIGLLSLSRGCVALLHIEGDENSLAAAAFEAGGDRLHSGQLLGEVAFSSVGLAVRAVAEYVTAFVDVLAGGKVSIPLAAIVRSALETGANAHYILTAADGRAVLQRALSLTIDDMLIPVKNSEFRTMDGRPVDGKAIVSDLRSHLIALGPMGSADRLPSKSKRVWNLLAELGPPDAVIYSQLSGVAHGVSTALAMFHLTGTGTYVLDRGMAAEYVGYLYACTATLGDRLVHALGVRGPDLDRWNGARDQATEHIGRFRVALYPDG